MDSKAITQELLPLLQRANDALAKAGPGASADDHDPMLALLHDMEEFSFRLAAAAKALQLLRQAYGMVVERAHASEVIFGIERDVLNSVEFTTEVGSAVLFPGMNIDLPHLGFVINFELEDDDVGF